MKTIKIIGVRGTGSPTGLGSAQDLEPVVLSETINLARSVARIWRDCDTIRDMFKPKITITPNWLTQIAAIEALKASVDKSKILPQNEIAFRYRYTVEAIHSSTSIEGNPLNARQITAVLAGKKIAQANYAITEVVNYKKALDYIKKRTPKGLPIDPGDVLKLHQIAMKDLLPASKTGQFRPGPIYVVNEADGREEVQYRGPGAKKVAPLVQDLLTWAGEASATLHPILAAGILHLEFVSIHPFSDGNGRLARLLTLLYLRLRDYDFRGALVPESYYARNRLAYYSALHQSQGVKYGAHIQNNLEPWLDYFIHALHVVARDLDDEVSSLSIAPDTSEPILLTRNEITILSYVSQFLAINLAEAEKILDLPTRTIQRYLKNLTEKNLLEKSGKGKKTYYQLSNPPTQNAAEADNRRPSYRA